MRVIDGSDIRHKGRMTTRAVTTYSDRVVLKPKLIHGDPLLDFWKIVVCVWSNSSDVDDECFHLGWSKTDALHHKLTLED